MKKLLLVSVFLAFAVAVQAGDAKTSKDQKPAVKEDSGCCSAKTATSTTAKTTYTSVEKEKMGCCSGSTGCSEKTVARKVLLSPKEAAELARR